MTPPKYHDLVKGALVFLLAIGDMHALTFITSIMNTNPILGLLSIIITGSANIYFYQLIKKGNY